MHMHPQLYTVLSRRDEHEEVFDVLPDMRLTAITKTVFDLRQQLRLWSIGLDEQRVRERIGLLRETLHRLLCETRLAGFEAHGSAVLLVLEQLPPLQRLGFLPGGMLQALYEWSRLFLASLADRTDARHAAMLIRHLGDRRWDRPASLAERRNLLASMVLEAFADEL
ncbi:hypothetical protein [Steroidobacter cummioxidans]|uniref:hypothetical protein n=1 Tax=Steroidobacter cummioxidans TaxID=1803913 RepID=UPI00129062FB|nr:hypothetical protein [Steroidobacter cummioxidans]